MKIKHYIYIKTKVRNKNRFLVKLYKNNINVYDIIEKEDFLYLKVLKEDYETIKKKIVTAKFYYVDDSGIFHLKKRITPLKVMSIILFLFLVNFFSTIIVRVDVIHANKEIRELVKNAMEEKGIRIWSIKKEYQELQEIKESILNAYKDKLEWLEIENVGMSYVIRIEERIINNLSKEEKYCHIVASKSGIIHNIKSTKGEVIVANGKYVSEGDILITGEIKFNEEVKSNVCAEGEVLAEVWYQTKVHLPVEYTTTTRTGKMRYNFAIETENGKYKILKSRLANYETEEKKLFRFFNLTFYKYEEYEVEEEKHKYDLESGLKKALFLADEKIKMKLANEEKIHTRKVLKKSINDSTIDVELFYSVIENITRVQEFSIATEEEGS